MLGFRLDLPGFESLSCSSVTEGQPKCQLECL